MTPRRQVLDFGVAKVIENEGIAGGAGLPTLMTAPGMIIGTPAGMAPELIQLQPAGRPDRRTQPWGDRAQMVSGELPFGRGT